MAFISVSNEIRVTLSILNAVSFLPQLYRILRLRSSKGISTNYVFWNLLCATEQLKYFVWAIFKKDPNEIIYLVHHPVTRGDKLNLYQTGVVWASFFILFVPFVFQSFCVCLPHVTSKRFYLATYLLYLAISFIPPALDINNSYPSPRNSYIEPITAFVFFFSMSLLNPLVTMLEICGVFSQLKETKRMRRNTDLRSPKDTALSVSGLRLQAVVFAAVAFTWVWRVPIEEHNGPNSSLWMWPWRTTDAITYWYSLLGFPAFDNMVFAMGQAVLLGVASKKGRSRLNEVDRETEPLLR